MKTRPIIALAIAAALLAGAFFLLHSSDREEVALQKTEAQLRHDGYKVDLSEFNFFAPADEVDRLADLSVFSMNQRMVRVMPTIRNNPALPSSSIVIWKKPAPSFINGNNWINLRSAMDEDRSGINAAIRAVLSGRFGANLDAGGGAALLLPHLQTIRNGLQTFDSFALLELHDDHRDAAWTNLLAATRLVTAWDAEPVEISQVVRISLAAQAFDATWQVLQAGDWSDERLAALQREWQGVDFFSRLPETVAFARAGMFAQCELSRLQPLNNSLSVPQIIRSPGSVPQGVSYTLQQFNYRRHGVFEDENDLLLFYRDREAEMRRAIQSPTYAEMRGLPGVTNQVFYRSNKNSGNPWQTAMNIQRMNANMMGRGLGVLARAAEAEARRRVLVTAIAVERYHGKHGAYPSSLAALAPEFLNTVPLDFMDGQPLRYRLTDDAHFVLYSVGLDCVDDGGEILKTSDPRQRFPFLPNGNRPTTSNDLHGGDIVWPRPAEATDASEQ
jgi:hypothetical protein